MSAQHRAQAGASLPRCPWCGDDPVYRAYHDREWGVPLHDDLRLFELLVLEGAQAGLSWITILRKRDNYRKAFDGFDPATVARYDQRKIAALLGNPGIVRNRLKIGAAIRNAKAVLTIQKEFGSLDAFLWQFVDGHPIRNAWKSLGQIPVQTRESDFMSRELKRRGLTFVGSTICYSLMQATGMVNDHLVSCFRHREIRRPMR